MKSSFVDSIVAAKVPFRIFGSSCYRQSVISGGLAQPLRLALTTAVALCGEAGISNLVAARLHLSADGDEMTPWRMVEVAHENARKAAYKRGENG
jgi:hypothetical protein